MIRGWFFRRRSNAAHARRRATRADQILAARVLRLEPLEDRRVLDAQGAATGDLVVDSSRPATSLLVQFRDTTEYAGSLRAYSAGSLTDSRWAITPGLREVNLAAGVELNDALTAYGDDPNVVYAEPNYRVQLNMIPNDPAFATEQWALHNTGQIFGLPGFDIRAPDAWELTTGDPSVVVAVIDTGIDYHHPDLAPNMWTNPGEIPDNRLDDDGNGYIDDVYGYDFVNGDGDPMDDYFHGTHVAGSIAAVANNGLGIAGVAPNARLMALKFLDSSGGGVTSDAIAALNYAVANGASISNNSWGGGPFSQAFKTAIQHASDAGHIFVASAGNYANNNDAEPFYPASYDVPNVISVAATDAGDHIAYFSNYGRTSVDIGAPGVDIYSTLPTSMTAGMVSQGLEENYGTLSGTSMAAPHVSGVLALLLSGSGASSPADAIAQVMRTADRVPSLVPRTVSGGRVNAAAALGIVPADTTPPKVVASDPSGTVTGAVSHVQLTFSEPIEPASLDLSDVLSFDGPQGAVIVFSVDAVPDSGDRKFTITFEPQSLVGTYALRIGPHIADRAGNELDQDGDGVGGIDVADDYTASFTITDSSALRFSSEQPVEIRRFDVFSSYITVDQDLPIADLNVHLNLTFPRTGNLRVWLVSPSGEQIDLAYRRGGNEANFQDTIFDDEAELSIVDGSPPFDGSFQPDMPLSTFDGQNAFGTWQLNIQNVSDVRNRGMLNSWAIEIIPGEGTVVGPHNDPPTAGDDSFTTTQDVPLIIDVGELLSNDNDPNDDPLVVLSVAGSIGGTVELNGNLITYSPDMGSLAPGMFEYLVSDGMATAVGRVTIAIEPRFNLHNGFDVNADTFISPLDSLLVINYLNAYGSSPIIGLGLAAGTKLYYDVIADNVIAANDALAVINYLNANPPNRGHTLAAAPEGEAPSAVAAGHDGGDLSAAAVDLLLATSGELDTSGAVRPRTGRRS